MNARSQLPPRPILLGLLFLALLGQAAFLGSDYPDKDPQDRVRPEPRPPRPRPIPPPSENEVADLLRRCRVGTPVHYDGLSVFPILARVSGPGYLSLDGAIGQLAIEETGTVSQVRIRNRASRPVFIMAGEMLIGGKQNRMVSADVVIRPDETVIVSSYCIEEGRWDNRASSFSSRKSLVTPEIRARAANSADQRSVWESVAKSASRLQVESESQDLQAVYDSEAIRRRIAPYRPHWHPIWRQRPIGLVVCRFGQVVGAELFSNESLFQSLRDKIIDSYVLDRLQYHHHHHARDWHAGHQAAENFLRRAQGAHLSYHSTPGAGRGLRLSGPVTGAGLSVSGQVVHLSLHAGHIHLPPPHPHPIPVPEPYPMPRPR
jgi:hypothetical protein